MGRNRARARGFDHAHEWLLVGQLSSVVIDNDFHPLDGAAHSGNDGPAAHRCLLFGLGATRCLLFIPRFAGLTGHRPIAGIEIIQLNAPRKQVPVPARRPLS